MDIAGLTVTTAGRDGLGAALDRAVGAAPTARVVGLLRYPTTPAPEGWRRVDVVRHVEGGDLAAVRAHLLSWDVLRSIGIAPVADTERAELGATVVQRMPARGPSALAPCRVVDVVDEPDRIGWSYAALPGHPFLGEEAFAADRTPTGLTCRVTSLSCPAVPLARAAGPLTRAVQQLAAAGYVRGMAGAAAGA